MTSAMPCPKCSGAPSEVQASCATCSGYGRVPSAATLDVEALPRRMAHALHAVYTASRELRTVPTAAEACIYDEEAISVRATAAALREAQRRGLVLNAGGSWFILGAALEVGAAPFERRYLRDTEASRV